MEVSKKDENFNHTPTPHRLSKSERNMIDFQDLRKEELNCPIMNGTFRIVSPSNIPSDSLIFGSRFIDELKKRERGFRKRLRLEAKKYADQQSTATATKAKTVQRSSQRTLLILTASFPVMTTFTRDITQAYMQSQHDFERNVFIKDPREMDVPKDSVLQVV